VNKEQEEMSEPILLIDTNYLCHRAFHAVGGLSYKDIGTGAIFGVLRDIVSLQDSFATKRCVFAFDLGLSYRHKLLPTYKRSRRIRHAEETEEEQETRRDFNGQVKRLRREYLPAAGFNNVFAARGFEADDIIASIAAALPSNEEGIIISNDHDLWQCLRPNIFCWDPQRQRAYSIGNFRGEWGLEPHQWADVKAYAGCGTDDVPGIRGVGEKTAAKWLRGELPEHTQAYAKLVAGVATHKTNLPLVRLPFPGTPEFEIKPDNVTEDKWWALADRLGMQSIKSAVPRTSSRRSKGRKREGFFKKL
jgi:DNA polymerase-1